MKLVSQLHHPIVNDKNHQREKRSPFQGSVCIDKILNYKNNYSKYPNESIDTKIIEEIITFQDKQSVTSRALYVF